jgi:hypothetical protein
MLNRAEYSDDNELEAEVMASLILRQKHTRQPAGAPEAPPGSEAVLARLERSFSLASSDNS